MAASAEEVRSFTRRPEPRSCRESSPEKNSENSRQRLRTGFGLHRRKHTPWIFVVGAAVKLSAALYLSDPTPLLEEERHAINPAPPANRAPLLFSWDELLAGFRRPQSPNLCRRDSSRRYLPIGAQWTETALWLVLVEDVQSWVNRAFDPQPPHQMVSRSAANRNLLLNKSRSLSERLVKIW